jgi:hypothetical protein
MKIYNEKSMVKKDHANFIAKKLAELGSKVPQIVEDDLNENLKEEYSLALLLSLASGGSSYQLTKEKILQINNEYFSIEESSIERMFQNSTSHQIQR